MLTNFKNDMKNETITRRMVYTKMFQIDSASFREWYETI